MPDEVEVVRVVHHPVDRARSAPGEVRAICRHRLHVDQGSVGVAPDPVVDVRGHVDHVSRAGHQASQPVRGRLGAARIWTGLNRVDVEVVGARVHRIRRKDPLEGDHDLLGAGLGRALGRPQAPRAKVHERVGQERGRVEIVRIPPRHVAHGIRIGAVERRAISPGGRGVPGRQRRDQRPLTLGRGHRGQRARLIDHGERPQLPLRVGGAVVVRPIGQRDTPRAHRARRIEAGRLAEGGLGLVMVEAVDEPQALVEIGLGLRRRALPCSCGAGGVEQPARRAAATRSANRLGVMDGVPRSGMEWPERILSRGRQATGAGGRQLPVALEG